MKKRLQHIDLPPHLEEFRKNYLAATEVEATLCGIITCYKMYGAYFIRSKSSLTGKRVRKDKRFRRTMHNAGLLAQASEWVTPVYNSLTEDWRCHDLYRKLVGLAVKLLHQGASHEAVQTAAWEELARLGYKTEWPDWEMPQELQQWVEEESREVRNRKKEKSVQRWAVNAKGQLVFEAPTSLYHAPPELSTVFYSPPDNYKHKLHFLSQQFRLLASDRLPQPSRPPPIYANG